jgi:hypothetical protein
MPAQQPSRRSIQERNVLVVQHHGLPAWVYRKLRHGCECVARLGYDDGGLPRPDSCRGSVAAGVGYVCHLCRAGHSPQDAARGAQATAALPQAARGGTRAGACGGRGAVGPRTPAGACCRGGVAPASVDGGGVLGDQGADLSRHRPGPGRLHAARASAAAKGTGRPALESASVVAFRPGGLKLPRQGSNDLGGAGAPTALALLGAANCSSNQTRTQGPTGYDATTVLGTATRSGSPAPAARQRKSKIVAAQERLLRMWRWQKQAPTPRRDRREASPARPSSSPGEVAPRGFLYPRTSCWLSLPWHQR